MCSTFRNSLIYKEVFLSSAPRSKFVQNGSTGIRSEGERHLLLRKEYGKCGVTRLLRKECRVDSRRKWLPGACSEGEHHLLLRKEYGKCGKTRLRLLRLRSAGCYGRYYLPLLATTGDSSVVARTSSHRLPVNGLYAASRSLTPRPPASPAATSKTTVRTAQHIPVSQRSREVLSFTMRGSSNQVIRKMHALSTIPLTGNAHFSPIALTNIYSRNPPFRIATGIKQSHTMKDFSILLIVIHLFIFQNACFGNQRRTISDNFG